MRYLIYTETFPSTAAGATRQTGIGRYCYDLASGLARTGRPVTVLTGPDAKQDHAPPGEGFSVASLGRAARGGVGTPLRAWKVHREIRRIAPTWVIVGDPDAHRVFALARRGLALPYCVLFYGTELRALRSAPEAQPVFGSLRARLAKGYIEAADSRVCISRYTDRELRSLLGGDPSDLILYPVVSELFLERPRNEEFQPSGSSSSAKVLRLITTGRISERKNQLRVLQVLARLSHARALDFHYYILGNVDSATHREYMHDLQEFISTHGLADSVSVVGGTADEEKIDYIDHCDVFIMLSQTVGSSVEGFGISAIEASCRGKPVIVSDEGGMPETVLAGITGFSLPVQDDDAIAAAILKLARDKALREAMGNAGSRFVRENFTPAAMGERLHRHLESRRHQPDKGKGNSWES